MKKQKQGYDSKHGPKLQKIAATVGGSSWSILLSGAITPRENVITKLELQKLASCCTHVNVYPTHTKLRPGNQPALKT